MERLDRLKALRLAVIALGCEFDDLLTNADPRRVDSRIERAYTNLLWEIDEERRGLIKTVRGCNGTLRRSPG